MDIVERAKKIIVSPKTEWPAIAAEEPNTAEILKGYVLPLALVHAIAHIIALGVIGRGMTASFSWGIAMGLIQFILAFVGVYLSAYVIAYLAPRFGSQQDLGRAVQLVAYSYTPVWVAGILAIVPVLGVLGFVGGIYGLYLMYLGMPHIMKTPQDRAVVYLVVSILAVIVTYWIITLLLTPIILGVFGLSATTMMKGM
jgi:sterol desaturase/sphingolipid hydroxylase (fatty acid hydroxylase superfamily)